MPDTQALSDTQARRSPTRDAPLVLPFTALDRAALPLAGGKAANLGELTRAGLPVPPGFCVTTTAYAQVADEADLDSTLADLAATPADDVARLAELAAAARAALLAAPVPAAIATAVAEAYLALGHDTLVPVAVRSSATAEDLPHASFAGQQDTYLNVVGVAAVLDTVRRCWASLWTDRAVSYRAATGIDHGNVRLAVVVQRLVEASVAGILFTANPVTGRRRQAVIDASPGLGEAIVSGAVNPDHFVVDTTTGHIVERRLGDKRVVVQAVAGGGTRRVERATPSDAACLTDDQIRALATLGARVEAHYRAPQDIEWAIDAVGTIWLVQARPITTLFPLPAGAPSGDDLRVYFSFNVAQGVYRPLTPMGLQAFRLIGTAMATLFGRPPRDPTAGPAFIVEAGQRLYLDVTPLLRSPLGRRVLLGATQVGGAHGRPHPPPRPRPAPGARANLPPATCPHGAAGPHPGTRAGAPGAGPAEPARGALPGRPARRRPAHAQRPARRGRRGRASRRGRAPAGPRAPHPARHRPGLRPRAGCRRPGRPAARRSGQRRGAADRAPWAAT